MNQLETMHHAGVASAASLSNFKNTAVTAAVDPIYLSGCPNMRASRATHCTKLLKASRVRP